MQNTAEKKVLFEDLGISKSLLNQLNNIGFVQPTPIQAQAIPVALKGQDVIGIAQTGTGKTMAFSIPALSALSGTKQKALIVLPTRELAAQVDEEIMKIGRSFGLKTAVLIGGASMHRQVQDLRRNPHVIIATPGRLIDLMEQGEVSLRDVKVLVLDEADRMLDMGFEPQIQQILKEVPEERQTMLFSATMPEAIAKITKNYMKSPVRIQVSRPGESAKKINQEAILVQKDDKLSVLLSILPQTTGPVIVFMRTKHTAKKLNTKLHQFGYASAEIHSNRSQAQRRVALEGFKSGKYRILVATDIAARGIDVNNIELVVNYDMPDQLEDYVHRIGRTGRAGKSGKAVSFVMPKEMRDMRRVEKLVGKRIDVERLKQVPGLPEEADQPYRDRPSRPQRNGGGGGGFGKRRRFGGRNGGRGGNGFNSDSEGGRRGGFKPRRRFGGKKRRKN